MKPIPVITLDGVSGVGKGTIGLMLAARLNWHFLDSGALYRILAWEAVQRSIALHDEVALTKLAAEIKPEFQIVRADKKTVLKVYRHQHDLTDMSPMIRTEVCGNQASQLSVHPQVREVLVDTQRIFRKKPGLVADGRDMGTMIFPDAVCKFFLTASIEARTQRRYAQLKEQGKHGSLLKLKTAILRRDTRDKTRVVAALRPASEAFVIDTTELGMDQVFSVVLRKLSSVMRNEDCLQYNAAVIE